MEAEQETETGNLFSGLPGETQQKGWRRHRTDRGFTTKPDLPAITYGRRSQCCPSCRTRWTRKHLRSLLWLFELWALLFYSGKRLCLFPGGGMGSRCGSFPKDQVGPGLSWVGKPTTPKATTGLGLCSDWSKFVPLGKFLGWFKLDSVTCNWVSRHRATLSSNGLSEKMKSSQIAHRTVSSMKQPLSFYLTAPELGAKNDLKLFSLPLVKHSFFTAVEWTGCPPSRWD